MEATYGTKLVEVTRIAMQPPFWVERPAVWLAQVDSQFTLAGIIAERTRFHHISSQLDHWYTAEVKDNNSPAQKLSPLKE
jgi:hypothetical protein